MSPIRAVVVYPDDRAEITYLEGFEGIQNIVGGYVERVGLDGCTCYVDEDGISKGLLRNQLATAALQTMLQRIDRSLLPGDYVKGVAVFVGESMTDDGVVESDLPEIIIEQFFPTAKVPE